MPTPRPRATHVAAVAIAAVLALTANTVSFAAGGPALLLGEKNKAERTTTLKSRSGPALKLKSKPGTAALAVSDDTLVSGLNADELDGLDAATLVSQAVGQAVTQAVAQAKREIVVPAPATTLRVAPWGLVDTSVIASGSYTFTVPTGDYLMSLQGLLRPGPGASAYGYACFVLDKALAESGNQSAIGAAFLAQAGDANTGDGALDQQVEVHLEASRTLLVRCIFDDVMRQIRPIKVLLEPITYADVAATPVP